MIYRDELGVGGYVDRRIITGTLQELIDEAEMFLSKYIAVGAKIEGWKRISSASESSVLLLPGTTFLIAAISLHH